MSRGPVRRERPWFAASPDRAAALLLKGVLWGSNRQGRTRDVLTEGVPEEGK